MGTKQFKIQKTVSVQTVQRALNDTRRWIRVLSNETISHLINKITLLRFDIYLRQITGSCDLMLFAQRSLWAALNSNTLPSQTYVLIPHLWTCHQSHFHSHCCHLQTEKRCLMLRRQLTTFFLSGQELEHTLRAYIMVKFLPLRDAVSMFESESFFSLFLPLFVQ